MVAGWGAYLVPFWMRRHDGPTAELRSIQGFSTAMRTLSRRKSGYVDGRYVLMPSAPARTAQPAPVHVSGAGVRRAVDHSLARRRQALLSLLVVSVVSLPLAILVGGLTVLLFAASLVATLGYSFVLRRETVRASERRRRARGLAHRRALAAAQSDLVGQAAMAAVAAQAAAGPPPMQAAPVRYVAAQAAPEPVEVEWRRVVGE